MTDFRSCLLASAAFVLFAAAPAYAADTTKDEIALLKAQVETLQKQINAMQVKQDKALAAAPATGPSVQGESGKEILPGVKFKMGGHVETTGIWRSRNEASDATAWNGNATNTSGLPFDNVANGHQNEFRGNARGTRISVLADADVDKNTKLGAYIESDFLGSGTTSNSVQTNSYIPRLRQAFGTVDLNDWGLHVLAGQAWSMATLNKDGITARKEGAPGVLDVGFLPGFVYTRNPQVRVVKDFANDQIHVGLSAESPQVTFGQVTVPTAIVTANTTGLSPLNTSASYSNDIAPDVIGKVAFDTGYGHYEVFGLTRFFRDNLNADFHDNVAVGMGGGVGAYVSVIPQKLEVQATFMGGQGIGRYAAGQMPDFAFRPDGGIEPLTMMAGLFGVVAHPDPTWDIFAFIGGEKVMRESQPGTFTSGTTTYNYGYGSNTATSADNSGCYTSGGTCIAQTEYLWQITPGVWKRLYKGDYGTMQVGAQYSLTRRVAFSDDEGRAPSAYQNVVLTSLRYSPF